MAVEKKKIANQRFGRWTATDKYIEIQDNRGKTVRKWLCRCDCGTERYVVQSGLTTGHSKSCGCLMREEKAKQGFDLTGRVFGELTVIEKSPSQKKRYGTFWRCRCTCGNDEYDVMASLLVSGKRTHCGSKVHEKNYYYRDITGMKIGMLTVLYKANGSSKGRKSVLWHCRCECGNEVELSLNNLLYGNRSSCGCQRNERAKVMVYNEPLVDGTNIGSFSRCMLANNTSGHKGVCLAHNKYMAYIGFKGKKYYLGLYENINDAIEVRKKAEDVLFGATKDYYDSWKKKADEDPEWASANPIQISVARSDDGFDVCFLPVL